MLVRRLSTVAAATVVTIALGAGSASAHFCYFKNGNENTDEKRAGSTALMPFSEYVQFTGICTEGAEMLAAAGGITMDTLMNGRGVMAAGVEGGNKAIGHLDFGAVLAAGPAAFAECGMDLPVWWFEE